MGVIYRGLSIGRHPCRVFMHYSPVVHRHLQARSGSWSGNSVYYSGPPISILPSIILTARILGLEMGLARVIGAVTFAVVIGLVMSFIFRKEERDKEASQMNIVPPPEKRPLWQTAVFFLLSWQSLCSPTGAHRRQLTVVSGLLSTDLNGG